MYSIPGPGLGIRTGSLSVLLSHDQVPLRNSLRVKDLPSLCFQRASAHGCPTSHHFAKAPRGRGLSPHVEWEARTRAGTRNKFQRHTLSDLLPPSDVSFKDSATSQDSTAPLGTRHPTTQKPVGDISQSNHDQQCPDMRSSCPGRACWRLGLTTSTDGEYS